jgi:hypothetical protein
MRALPVGLGRAAILVAAVLVATCTASVCAQDDLRDVVTLTEGAPLRGRVLARY